LGQHRSALGQHHSPEFRALLLRHGGQTTLLLLLRMLLMN
jgi:hypothetical protein